ncbi:MAG: hypothetical protein GF416_08525 [Candidatus Altiarchaeales archaeon]|nr:hypothetical protein [Candidatus Altiarchaeales archaeon]MBD3417160.1 hypothetical protein [Candidatus Altiarchaeales archaeon]
MPASERGIDSRKRVQKEKAERPDSLGLLHRTLDSMVEDKLQDRTHMDSPFLLPSSKERSLHEHHAEAREMTKVMPLMVKDDQRDKKKPPGQGDINLQTSA